MNYLLSLLDDWEFLLAFTSSRDVKATNFDIFREIAPAAH